MRSFRLNSTTTAIWFLIISLVVVLLLFAFSLSQVFAQIGDDSPPEGTPPGGAPPQGNPAGGGGNTVNPVLNPNCGVYMLDGEDGGEQTDQIYNSTEDDVSNICVVNGGILTLVNPTIIKSGDTSSSDNSSFYGLNAAVLVGPGSTASITGGTVTTDGEGTNGVFAAGEGASVTLSEVTIYAVGDGAHGVMATLGGSLILNHVDIETTDAHSGAIATDRGSGTITVTGGTVTASGQDSPGIYSTGIITVSDAVITATGSESVVIEGANSVTLTNTLLSSSKEDKWGVMIYQSMSGDAEGTEGVFTMTGGTLANTASSGPLFFVTNSTGIISLTDVEVMAASGILVDAHATDRWGKSGSNGGNVILTADEQLLTGDMIADSLSVISASLQNGSSLTGAVNPENTARAVTLTLDESSMWNITRDSYLTCLIDADPSLSNIADNGHTIYYDASMCDGLGGESYPLLGGGVLQPIE